MLGSRILKAFIEKRSYNTAERIMMCAFIALSGTFYFYDYYQPFAEIARIVITVLIFAVWLYCAFCAGKDKQWGFAVFSCFYWVIPYIYIIYYNSRDNVRGYSKWLSLFNKIADMLFSKPFEYAAGRLETDSVTLVCVILGGVTLLFFGGFMLSFFYERSGKESAVRINKNYEQASVPEKQTGSLNDFLGL